MGGPGFINWRNLGDIPKDLSMMLAGDWLKAWRSHWSEWWWSGWGDMPDLMKDREQKIQAFLDDAPKLIPVFRDRWMASEPCASGQAVQTIHDYVGVDLLEYLAAEFGFMDVRARPRDVPSDRGR